MLTSLRTYSLFTLKNARDAEISIMGQIHTKIRRTPSGHSYLWKATGLALLFMLGGLSGCKKDEPKVDPFADPEVLITDVVQKDVPITREWIGSLDGSTNAQIRAKVSGYIISQDYQNGVLVKKGDVLFDIDPRPLQATLDQANADLATAQANQVKAQLTADRYVELYKENAVSQQDRDNAVQSNDAAKAQVMAQQAAVSQAQINLQFTKVTAPLDGIAAIANKNVGDLAGPGDTLTTISVVDPIWAYFQISEQGYMKVADRFAGMQDGKNPGPAINMAFSDGTPYKFPGKFKAIDRSVNDGTGTIRIAAEFPNPGNILRPGQFARISVVVETIKDALLVPQESVEQLQGSYQVVVINDNKASVRQVTTGARFGQFWVITSGLKLGEKVIVQGLQKVKDGQTVTPKPYVAPPDSVATVQPSSN